MNRTHALLICLAATAIGLQPWLGSALATGDAAKEEGGRGKGEVAETSPGDASYLGGLIVREREFGQSPAPAAVVEAPPADAGGSPGEPGALAPGGEPCVGPDKPAEPAVPMPRVADPTLPLLAAPELTLPAAEPVAPTPDDAVLPEPPAPPAPSTPAQDAARDPPAEPTDDLPQIEPAPVKPLVVELPMPEPAMPAPAALEPPAPNVESLPEPKPAGEPKPEGEPEAIDPKAEEPETVEPETDEPKPDAASPTSDEPTSDEPTGEPLFAPPTLDAPTPDAGAFDESTPAEPSFAPPMFLGPTDKLTEELMPAGEAPAEVTESRAEPEDEPVRFPPLPPDPYAEEQPVLPPLAAELHYRGGSYLYVPEGDGFQELLHHAGRGGGHEPPKRLPEHFQAPQPCTRLPLVDCVPRVEYLGADPIQLSPKKWPSLSEGRGGGYQWEPRFVAHGQYDVFGIAFREGDQRADLLGHNLTLDADLRLTGTERFHLQHRPIGEDGTGGSFYRFSDPDGAVDNSTAEPARLWFEGELASVLSGLAGGGWIGDPTIAWDVHFTLGKFPLQQHNNLLINDEVVGVLLGQNNLRPRLPILRNASNVHARAFWLFDDINSQDSFPGGASGSGGSAANDGLTGNVLGADAFIDYHHAFVELTYAYRQHSRSSAGDAHYLAASATRFFGTATASARALVKIAGPADRDGQLFALEWNTHRRLDEGLLHRLGVQHAVVYATGFYATKGWDPIASANFNRVRASFEVNPLVQIARGDRDDTPGAALGVQLFGEGDDSSLTPEIAYEAPAGVSVFGAGLKYQRKLSPSSFVELRGLVNFSDHSPFERDGVFASHHWLF